MSNQERKGEEASTEPGHGTQKHSDPSAAQPKPADARHADLKRTELKHAVALAYGPRDAAPKVVAKGYGLVAEEIIARAREHGVFLHESRELVSLLMQVDLDREIPPALYRAIAELLVWLGRIEVNVGANKG